MTTNSPRIYVYKITFYEVLHYYYGVHKEKFFDEYYMGSPKTHKDFWELYTPKKEYIEFFEYSDEGYTEARIFEDSLIAPVLNEELCLNEHCGGFLSLEVLRKNGKNNYEKNIGIHSWSKEQFSQNGKKSGKIAYKKGVGVHNRSKEQIIEDGRKGGKISGNKHKENKTGVCGQSQEKMRENGKKAGKISYERGVGIHAQTKEEKSELGKRGGKISGNKHKENKTGVFRLTQKERREFGKRGAKASNSQKWQCTETGYTSNAGGLTCYQKKRGIDPSNRIKVDGPRSWEITFEDGKVVVTTKSLKAWAEENGYSYSGLIHVKGGRSSTHKGIIKVVSF
jgi:hypothetical protein